MIQVYFKPSFVKQAHDLERDLLLELEEKIELLKDRGNHKMLKVHKLHGKLSNCYSFAVNYKVRAVFQYESRNSLALLVVGDHDIYR